VVFLLLEESTLGQIIPKLMHYRAASHLALGMRTWSHARNAYLVAKGQSDKALAASLLDKQARFFQDSASLKGSESGGGLAPLGSSPLPDLQSQNQHGGETERKYL
jgi:hypothetical protein